MLQRVDNLTIAIFTMKKLWIVIVLVLAVAAVWWFKGGGSSEYAGMQATGSPSASASPVKATVAYRKTTAPAASPAMSYSQLVQQYGTNRIQFDDMCQAQPKSIVFKVGTSFMLDNRSSQPRQISMDGHTYNLGGYGYQILTLSGSPRLISITCGALPNVGLINLEANVSGQ